MRLLRSDGPAQAFERGIALLLDFFSRVDGQGLARFLGHDRGKRSEQQPDDKDAVSHPEDG
jgi:hypothetical protein